MTRMARLMRRWLTADGRALAKRLEAVVSENERAALLARLHRPVPGRLRRERLSRAI